MRRDLAFIDLAARFRQVGGIITRIPNGSSRRHQLIDQTQPDLVL
ncbi:hypothetical protein [Rhizobium tropici]|nr:hypothetical protein [Rhizobium tropici]